MYSLMICLLPYWCILASFVQDCSRVHTCQGAMYRYAVLGLRVAKHHGFDKVTECQEPLKTHRFLKERISP
jgi:hypothetical protein